MKLKNFQELRQSIVITEDSSNDPMVAIPGLYSAKMSAVRSIIKELAKEFSRMADNEEWEKMRYFLKINKLDPYLKVVK